MHKPSLQLNELLDSIGIKGIENDCTITGLTLDSRHVKPGYLFLAYPGLRIDGRDFIDAAVNNGAAAVIAEANQYAVHQSYTVPIILVSELQQRLSRLAGAFYGHPSQQLQTIGVTGTNGKTSCTQFIAHAFTKNNIPCAVIGTLGYGFPGQLTTHAYTTPDALNTQRLLYELHTQGAQAVAMEVSSHALAQGRVEAIDFHTAIFTNLTRDHLDYHGDMQSYAKAKQRLFDFPSVKQAIINIDDPMGYQLAKVLATRLNVIVYSLNKESPAITNTQAIITTDMSFSSQGISAVLSTPWGKGVLQTKLLGRFNLSNLLTVVALLGLQGISFETILQRVAELQGVPGRMETYGGNGNPLVVIDYAHTPDALEQVLQALRPHCAGQLWCVFGCGGNRDKGKRPLMGYIAQQYADQIIITDDNPRHEQPKHIVSEILQGMPVNTPVVIEHDRRRAIEHAITCAKVGDIVLIAGKGHEDYQQIGDEMLPFCDAVEVKLLLNTV